MKCFLKRIGNDSYFNKNLFIGQNHWTPKKEARLFKSVDEARKIIKKYKLKNVEVEKCTK